MNALQRLLHLQSFSRAEAAGWMDELLEGRFAPEQIGAILIALRMKGETAEEIAGFVDALKKRATPIQAPESENWFDVCGTGGDGFGTINVSTTVAFVLAGAGVQVAKHGNRSVSSRSGSFDVLEALGISFDTEPSRVASAIQNTGLGFIFAPAFHPALKALAPLRKSLGVYTFFNAVGPLLNPAGVQRQLIGVNHSRLLTLLPEVLKLQGAKHVWVVRGEEGLDEISLCGKTQVAELKNGEIRHFTLTPDVAGLRSADLESLRGGGATENAGVLADILKGQETGPKADWVLLNSAAGLLVAGKAQDLKEGVEKARASIESGAAWNVLRKLRARK